MTANEVIEDLLRRVAAMEQRISDIEAFPGALAQVFGRATQAIGGGDAIDLLGVVPKATHST